MDSQLTVTQLTVTVLGCDGSYPGPGGAGSGYLVRYGATALWLDAGPGTLANLQLHVPIAEITAVVVSHEHVDHWSDLEHLGVACKWREQRLPVPLYCEADLLASMHIGRATDSFSWRPIGPESAVEVGGLRLTFSRTDHPVPTLAVRVDAGGRSLGYSADSGPGWGPVGLGAGLGLALVEATHLADMEGTVAHMSARQAGQSAREAGVERLVITHRWPGVDAEAARAEAAASFGGPVENAVIGARFEV